MAASGLRPLAPTWDWKAVTYKTLVTHVQSDAQGAARLASAHCAQCHGLDDKAPSPNTGGPSFPEIGRRRDPDGLPALLGQVTREGHYAMPRRRTTAADRRSLAAYIAEATERSDRR